MKQNTRPIPPRFVLVEALRVSLGRYFDPLPTRDAFLRWLRLAGIPVIKANPGAAKGGGPCRVDAVRVEKFLETKFGVPGANQPRKQTRKEAA